MNIMDLDRNYLTVVCTSNTKYLQYVFPFFESLNKNCKDINIVIRLVNDNTLFKKYQNLNIYTIYDKVKLQDDIILNDKDIKEYNYEELTNIIKNNNLGNSIFKKREAIYCSNIKFNTINFLLNNNFKHILYLDVDTIVREDINCIIKETKNNDLAMFIDENDIDDFITKHNERYIGLNAGFMYLNNTKKSKIFYKELEKRVKDDFYDLDADEVEFQKLLKESDISIKFVDKKYKDNGPKYENESLMWSGQSDEKILNNLFKEEKLLYDRT